MASSHRDVVGGEPSQDPETRRRSSDAEAENNFLRARSGEDGTRPDWAFLSAPQTPDWWVMAESERKWSGPLQGLADRLVETRAAVEEAMRLCPTIIGLSRIPSNETNSWDGPSNGVPWW